LLRVFTNIESVKKEWNRIDVPYFLQTGFLQIYYQCHPKIRHLFVIDTNMRLYAHIFKLTFNKTKNYLQRNLVTVLILKFIRFDVLYLTNSYITNVPSFVNKHPINLKKILMNIKHYYSLIVIPDFLFHNMVVEDDNYLRVEVEEEMVLDIRSEWSGLDDYILALKKKYRNKIKKIINRTSTLKIKNLTVYDLENYANDIQFLFNQVAESSRFKGPKFNTSSFISFFREGFMRVDGYFLDEKLVGFSSEIQKEKKLYSYFVGFDKNINKSIPIYGRILLENITSAIKFRKERLVLGRTANEYKSNFGAVPIRSYVYLRFENKFLSFILKPVISRLGINKWLQRKPFKS
jgi:hypothetical protein